MTVLIVICCLIFVGAAFFLMRSTPGAKTGPQITDADAQVLAQAVRERLNDRLAGWTLETGPAGALELIALESATERRLVLNLGQLAEAWLPLHASGATEDADAVLDDFVDGVTGTDEAEESEGSTWIREALSLRLYKEGATPKGAIARPVGPLVAVLVMRNVSGRPETVLRDEMQSWGVDEDEAFRIAIENLSSEAEDSLALEALGDEEPPEAYQIAPGDPLAASYALVPALGTVLRKRFKGGEPLIYLGEEGLVAILGEGEPEGVGALLIDGGQRLDSVKWPATAGVA